MERDISIQDIEQKLPSPRIETNYSIMKLTLIGEQLMKEQSNVDKKSTVKGGYIRHRKHRAG